MKKGWEVKTLGEVCEFQGGSQPPKSNFIFDKKDGYVRFLQIRDFKGYKRETYIPITNKNRLCKEDDILVGRYGASVGNVLTGLSGSYNVALMKFLPIADFDKRFLFLFLTSTLFQDPLLRISSRSAQDGFSKDDIRDFKIPVPPIREQKRIVKILDEKFQAIEQLKNIAEEQLTNTKELLDSRLNDVFKKMSLEDSEDKVGDIARVEYGYTDKSSAEGDFRYIRITDISSDGFLKETGSVYVKSNKENIKFTIFQNDLLMARTGATFGKVLFFDSAEKAIFASYLIRIHFNDDSLNKLYWYFSKTQNYWNQANKLMSGAAQPQFNGAAVKEIIFPYTKNKKKVSELIEKFDELSEKKKALETIFQKKIVDLEELKKSYLHEAFSGNL